jgi:hypothetical protein
MKPILSIGFCGLLTALVIVSGCTGHDAPKQASQADASAAGASTAVPAGAEWSMNAPSSRPAAARCSPVLLRVRARCPARLPLGGEAGLTASSTTPPREHRPLAKCPRRCEILAWGDLGETYQG